ncbi:MAG: hypothetical protein AAFO94_02420, partial [Bacteroidota bacterium]
AINDEITIGAGTAPIHPDYFGPNFSSPLVANVKLSFPLVPNGIRINFSGTIGGDFGFFGEHSSNAVRYLFSSSMTFGSTKNAFTAGLALQAHYSDQDYRLNFVSVGPAVLFEYASKSQKHVHFISRNSFNFGKQKKSVFSSVLVRILNKDNKFSFDPGIILILDYYNTRDFSLFMASDYLVLPVAGISIPFGMTERK